MIVGTAGHIDHGKTTLVRALTGVDTDRLPEEKKRGISIELGYAYVDLPGAPSRIGFIDVPGHERLVHTMLAGATGIDHALLLVAADDGVMPQTREHLAVLSLLGITRGTVVITKADRADEARRAAVRAEVHTLLAGTPLQAAPVVEVSAVSGLGIAELKALLAQAACATAPRADETLAFRLAVDRAFTLDGAGTVVTGTAHAGSVAVGDELALVPSARDTVVRVRSIHAQNRQVARAQAGERCALALAGIARDDVQRGQWLVAPAAALAATRIDTLLTLWHGETRALRSGTTVHVHVGAATVQGSVAVLDAPGEAGDALAPGATGRVQVVLHAPLAAWHGDRVVLRDASASRTIAGGRVLDPLGPVRYRRTPQRLAELDAQSLATPQQRLRALLDSAPHGLDLQRHAAAQGLASMQPLLDTLPPGTLRQADARGTHVLGPGPAATARSAVLETLARLHETHPDELGPDAARLRRAACPRLPEGPWQALLQAMQAAGDVAVRGAFVHLPAHGVRLSAVDERIFQKAAPLLAGAGFEGAWARDIARDIHEPEPLVRTALARLARSGELHQVVRDLVYPHAAMTKLAAIARQAAAEQGQGEVTAADFRDRTGLGRKRAIQILEYLDRIGLLRRVGDVHKLRSDSRLFSEAAA